MGVCVSASEKTEPYDGTQFTYTEYTFQVFEVLKGDVGNTIMIKQFGRRAGLGSIIGMPSYEPNQKYLLFLNDDSHLGLTTPVGLFQVRQIPIHWNRNQAPEREYHLYQKLPG